MASKPPNHRQHICSVLKKADGGDAGCTDFEARGCIFDRDAANGQHWQGHRFADLSQRFQSLWGAEVRFGWRDEDGTEKNVVGAIAFGLYCAGKRMARHAYQKILDPWPSSLRTDPLRNISHG